MKKKKIAVSDTSEQSLAAKVLVQEKAGHYKEAIALYKKLLQTSELEQYRQQLGYCYIQRAISFANKGMIKEALVMWENHCEHVEAPYQAYDQYLVWLIQTNNTAKVKDNLASLTAEQIDKQYPLLASILGLWMLTERSELQVLLPQDSALISHLKVVQTALQAWQDENLTQFNECLKQLPYRSAFRDLRTVLSAVVLMPDDIDQARTLLNKVPPHSVYAPLAAMLLACLQENVQLIDAMAACSHTQFSCIGDIKGLDRKQLAFIEQFIKQQEKCTDKAKFSLALQYQSLIGAELTQQFCQAVLTHYPAGKKEFKKQFGALDEFEEYRVQALQCERDNDAYEAEHYWQKCIRILAEQDVDNGLKIALIIRHMAAKEPDEGERIILLSESLDHDPSDRACYLHILRYYAQHKTMAKEHKQWLAKSLKQFPEDVDILVQAVNSATQNKTFKKASQYALKILKIDPLNTFAKQTLFASHIAHARRQIQEKKYALVDKELQQAEQLSIGKLAAYQGKIMRGILCFVSQDKQQGVQLMTEALSAAHADPVNMQFHAAIEALLSRLPVTTILRELPAIKECVLSAEQVTQLLTQIKRCTAENIEQEYLFKALDKIKAPLKKSLTQLSTNEAFLLTACQEFDAIQHFELLRHCAKLGFKQWAKPIWYYYKVYSETNNQPERCNFTDQMSLQNYQQIATEEKEYQTAMLLEQFLDRYYTAHPQRNMGFLEDIFGGYEEEEDDEFSPLDELFGHLPSSVQAKLDDAFDDVARKMTPDQLIVEMIGKGDNGQAIIMAVMQDPDVFTALMLIKVADKLGLDIGVSVGDVLELFDVKKKGRSFPFPF